MDPCLTPVQAAKSCVPRDSSRLESSPELGSSRLGLDGTPGLEGLESARLVHNTNQLRKHFPLPMKDLPINTLTELPPPTSDIKVFSRTHQHSQLLSNEALRVYVCPVASTRRSPIPLPSSEHILGVSLTTRSLLIILFLLCLCPHKSYLVGIRSCPAPTSPLLSLCRRTSNLPNP